MEMSFCHLGFARPVVLLPKAQMLLTTVFPEFAGEGKGEARRERQTDRQTDTLTEQKGRERRENPSQGQHHSAYYFV